MAPRLLSRYTLSMPGNHEAELKVAPDADLAEIKKAYRRAALALHPDHNPHPDAARRFRRITEAYRVLEAEARKRQPEAPRRKPTWDERLDFALADVDAMIRRWPPGHWTQVVDGLPASIWVASALEVLDREWAGELPHPVAPTPEGIAAALARWPEFRRAHPLPAPVPRTRIRTLEAAFQAVEARLEILRRSRR